jgi:hypothetical protein
MYGVSYKPEPLKNMYHSPTYLEEVASIYNRYE